MRVRPDPALAARPDLELLFAPVALVGEGLVQPPAHGVTLGVILLRPRSMGSITLRSADPAAAPRIDPRYLTDPDGADYAALSEGVRLCLRIAEQPALAGLVGDLIAPTADDGPDVVDASIRRYAQTLYHPVGTCRMGTDAASVVDPELRVRGVQALRVVDASMMPQIIRGHTNAPTIMLAERAADLLRNTRGVARGPGSTATRFVPPHSRQGPAHGLRLTSLPRSQPDGSVGGRGGDQTGRGDRPAGARRGGSGARLRPLGDLLAEVDAAHGGDEDGDDQSGCLQPTAGRVGWVHQLPVMGAEQQEHQADRGGDAASGFAGHLVDWAARLLRTTLAIVREPAGQRGVAVIPCRWWADHERSPGGDTPCGVPEVMVVGSQTRRAIR